MNEADLTVVGAGEEIAGPLLFLQRSVDVGLNDAVDVIDDYGRSRHGRVATLDRQRMVVELLDTSSDLALGSLRVRFHGTSLRFGLGPGLLGRVYNGLGEPIDDGPPIPTRVETPVSGRPLNPTARDLPTDFIETGVTAIDLMNSLVRGQKLPIFSASGLPHDELATRIAQNAKLLGDMDEEFAIVFVGIGVSHSVAERFRIAVEAGGAMDRTALFLNLASESSIQRLLTPRYALTAAEYLAFEEGRHVLVVMTDMTNYCEALREVSASHGEIPGRKGYPGYMYSDLASIFERAGRLRGGDGSLTQLPILTMPGDDISHPIPDLTGYITEGQIVLDRDLNRQGIHPPVHVLPSLSRLMDEGTGEGFTHTDHPALSAQLYAAYARSRQVRTLASVVGEEGLPPADRRYLAFGDEFESRLIRQAGRRSLEESMAIGWELLKALPADQMSRLSDEQIERYLETDGNDGQDDHD